MRDSNEPQNPREIREPRAARSNNVAILDDLPTGDPDLAAVIAAWAHLPAAVRAGILAMVRAAGKFSPRSDFRASADDTPGRS